MSQFAVMALCAILLAHGLAYADDWPQWLGPNHDSVWRETGIVRQFPAGGPVRKWRVGIAGGYAGPAVAQGRVFVTDYVRRSGDPTNNPSVQNKLQGTERVICLDAASGQEIWKYEYDCPYVVSYPGGPRATPTVDGERVYTLGTEGNLHCLNVEDGAIVWSKDLTSSYNTSAPFWGFSAHPLVDGNKLICVVGGEGSTVVAFDKQTGAELWRALDAAPGYCPASIIDVHGTRQVVIWHSQAINGLEPETGKLLWSVPLKPDYGMAIAVPRQSGDYLFAGGLDSKSVLLRIDRSRATEVWRGSANRGIGPVSSTPFIESDYLYGVDRFGQLRCIELATGRRLWETLEPMTERRTQNSGTAFLVKHVDRFFIASETGELIIAALSPKGYEEISRCKMLEPTSEAFGRQVVWSHPAFANKCVYARNDKEIVCLSLAR